jgi:hypothetical protein
MLSRHNNLPARDNTAIASASPAHRLHASSAQAKEHIEHESSKPLSIRILIARSCSSSSGLFIRHMKKGQCWHTSSKRSGSSNGTCTAASQEAGLALDQQRHMRMQQHWHLGSSSITCSSMGTWAVAASHASARALGQQRHQMQQHGDLGSSSITCSSTGTWAAAASDAAAWGLGQ